MSLHTALPVGRTVHLQDRLRTDGSGIEQQFCAGKRHTACRLRKPLIPADAHADLGIPGVPHLKSGIPRREVELFLVEVVVRDMGFAVDAQDGAVRINNGNGIVQHIACLFIEADRQHHV